MGLHISQKIAKSHNGQITVESEEGSGSTFSLKFEADYVEEDFFELERISREKEKKEKERREKFALQRLKKKSQKATEKTKQMLNSKEIDVIEEDSDEMM